MYKVIKDFIDLQDNNFAYSVGNEYPRRGAKVLQSRINELIGSNNRQHCPLIEEVVEEAPKKKTKAVEEPGEK